MLFSSGNGVKMMKLFLSIFFLYNLPRRPLSHTHILLSGFCCCGVRQKPCLIAGTCSFCRRLSLNIRAGASVNLVHHCLKMMVDVRKRVVVYVHLMNKVIKKNKHRKFSIHPLSSSHLLPGAFYTLWRPEGWRCKVLQWCALPPNVDRQLTTRWPATCGKHRMCEGAHSNTLPHKSFAGISAIAVLLARLQGVAATMAKLLSWPSVNTPIRVNRKLNRAADTGW